MATLSPKFRTAQIYVTVGGLIFETASENNLHLITAKLRGQYGRDKVGIFADPPTWELHPESPNNKSPFVQ